MTKTLHHRACHLCEAICGLTIETEDRDDGRHILSIKGDARDSFSRGHICPKAVALQDIQNDPDRVRQPLRKVDGQWQPIAWDAAFALVAERLSAIQAEHGSRLELTDGPFPLEEPGGLDAWAEALEGWGEAIAMLRAYLDFSVDIRPRR